MVDHGRESLHGGIQVIENERLIRSFIMLLTCDHQCDSHESKGKGRAFTTVYHEWWTGDFCFRPKALVRLKPSTSST
jgi:hypothetical protein